jgi:hypothetical protein
MYIYVLYIPIPIYIYIYIYIYMYVCIYVCICVCVYMCTYIYSLHIPVLASKYTHTRFTPDITTDFTSTYIPVLASRTGAPAGLRRGFAVYEDTYILLTLLLTLLAYTYLCLLVGRVLLLDLEEGLLLTLYY